MILTLTCPCCGIPIPITGTTTRPTPGDPHSATLGIPVTQFTDHITACVHNLPKKAPEMTDLSLYETKTIFTAETIHTTHDTWTAIEQQIRADATTAGWTLTPTPVSITWIPRAWRLSPDNRPALVEVTADEATEWLCHVRWMGHHTTPDTT